jgi:hypothetical protein
MATTVYKVLGKKAVTANTDALAYTVPASTSAIVSSIIICNTGATARTFRIALCPGAIASVVVEDYIAYDCTVSANDTTVLTIGVTLATANQVLVRASHAEVVFTLVGSEIS